MDRLCLAAVLMFVVGLMVAQAAREPPPAALASHRVVGGSYLE